MSGKIVPKNKTKGVDFCAVDPCYYIVRSDLGCYMRSIDFHRGASLEVFSLHPSCADGDHYLATQPGLFFIIKGNYYRTVTNMNTDDCSFVYTLHEMCQGGDHYLSSLHYFYVIYQDKGIYRRTTNMSKYENGEEFPLHPNCKDGLYYGGTTNLYFVKPQDEWGIQYVRTSSFTKEEKLATYSFNPSVVNFLPGGIGVTKGPAYGEWTCIRTINNDSDAPVDWEIKITKRTGYEKAKLSGLQQNWKVSADLTVPIIMSQFALRAEYGGSFVKTEKETWREATDVEQTVRGNLKAQGKVCIWTYQLGLGKEPVLYCRDIRMTYTSDPPTDVPLPPASD
ncbi:uncharacterized protein RB166_016152 [Leptodactylus fuscus]